MVTNEEDVVRMLFPNRILNGRVLKSAFTLRSQLNEDYLSVFRTVGPTFKADLQHLDKGRNCECSIMNVACIRDIKFNCDGEEIACDVIEKGNIEETSHAGIVTYINNKQWIGGHENEIVVKRGHTIDIVILAVQHRLASIAQKQIKHTNELLGVPLHNL